MLAPWKLRRSAFLTHSLRFGSIFRTGKNPICSFFGEDQAIVETLQSAGTADKPEVIAKAHEFASFHPQLLQLRVEQN